MPSWADPIATTNQNPLLGTAGLPLPLPADVNVGTDVGLLMNWSSNAIVQVRGDDALVIDSEPQELRFIVTHSITDQWAVRFELPYYRSRAGSLDSFIDDWHNWFGLPEGDRPLLPRDQLQLFYRDDGVTLLNSRSAQSGIGDISLAAGKQWIRDERRNVGAWFSVNLPTSASNLYPFEDHAADVTLTFSADQRIGDSWQFFGQASATINTGSDYIPGQTAVLWSSHLAVEFALTSVVSAVLQLQAHTALVPDSDLELLGDSVVLTLGGRVRTGEGWDFQFGMSEDIAVEASPDVVFILGVNKRWN